MPSVSLPKKDCLYHIYNSGVEKRVIFSDQEDYQTFLSFLQEYLTSPDESNDLKREFTVRGRVFKGTPHQPKNYFNKINLIAYSLMPNHFHLVLEQSTNNVIPSFIRSLCTRYSMYFNRKHSRSGSLFEGPYKSAAVDDPSQIEPLISFIHHEANPYSSHNVYSKGENVPWIKARQMSTPPKNLTNKEALEILGNISFETSEPPLERSLSKPSPALNHHTVSQTSRLPEISALFAVFVILVGLGIRNVQISEDLNVSTASIESSSVLSGTTELTPAPEAKTLVVVDISSGTDSINLRMEPTNNSTKVGEARNGDVYEFVSVNTGWYQIRLSDNQTAFIRSEYTYLQESNN